MSNPSSAPASDPHAGHAASSHAAGSHAAGSHGEHDVHVFESVGIQEGNARVPRWYVLAMALLVGFCAVYIATYLFGAQPSAAEFKHSK